MQLTRTSVGDEDDGTWLNRIRDAAALSASQEISPGSLTIPQLRVIAADEV
jgi:hypothetical protein